ncbi:ABC transporter permease [Saccharophagus sp. K07]|jgi:putative ABC transport system permease protein|uniref:ABC transporter permease n=1 Tax=Saccharophagus sp. K07 TaxID=2283636 RepID=UPI00165274D5|nr:ABC transporter permease [Saccharophagus sp. K07]MBC6905810.1 ABC transporter permease [Saccharophagus sp. K07]
MFAIILLNLRTIPLRFWMSLASVTAIAVVVAVLLTFLAMANGFRTTLEGSGSDDFAMMLRSGSQAELTSVLTRDQVNIIAESAGIARDHKGALISAELYLTVDAKQRNSQSKVNLPFRGLDERGLELRPNIHLKAGRMFEPGKNEIVVGEAIQREFAGFELGNTVKLGNTEWQVVGIFSARGSIFDGEIWTDVRTLQNQFNRGNTFQIVRAKLVNTGDVNPILNAINADQRLNLDVKTEKAFYQKQSQGISNLIFYIGWPLAITMSLGALAGALNTMYNSVAQRTGEIATLRAIGFSGLPIFTATLLESLVLSFVGGIIGTTIAFLFFDGISASTMGNGFTQITFQFEMNANVFIQGIILALTIGFSGGLHPAFRAARLPVKQAFATIR